MLRMNTVRVFGAHTSSCGTIADAWRDIAKMIAGHLGKVFGDGVCVEYVDIFGLEMSDHPDVLSRILRENLQVPVVYIDEVLFSSGGKINGPALRRKIEELRRESMTGSVDAAASQPESARPAPAGHLMTETRSHSRSE